MTVSNTVEIRLAARDEASAVINNVVGNLRGMVAQMAAMAGVTAAGAGLGALVVQGVKFNSVMEDSKLGLAALIMSTTNYTDAAGKAASKQDALAAAMSAVVEAFCAGVGSPRSRTCSYFRKMFHAGLGV